MTSEELAEFGLCAGLSHAALADRLAEYIGINRRTAERFISGKNEVPPWMDEKIVSLGEILIMEYQDRITKIKEKISALSA